MPSKIRVILTTANGTLKGSRAVAMLYGLAKNAQFTASLPEGWAKWSKIKRMKYLQKFLPQDVKLTCIRETKHTRKNKSLYLKTFRESSLNQIEGPVRPDDHVPPIINANNLNNGVQFLMERDQQGLNNRGGQPNGVVQQPDVNQLGGNNWNAVDNGFWNAQVDAARLGAIPPQPEVPRHRIIRRVVRQPIDLDVEANDDFREEVD